MEIINCSCGKKIDKNIQKDHELTHRHLNYLAKNNLDLPKGITIEDLHLIRKTEIRDYCRKWRQAHPEKLKDYQIKWRKSKDGKEKSAKAIKKYQDVNKEKMKEYAKVYVNNLKEKKNQYTTLLQNTNYEELLKMKENYFESKKILELKENDIEFLFNK
jgi:hypothetical protein